MSETVRIPFEYHRYIIGKNGGEVRALMNEFLVNIAIPPTKDESDEVVVTGPPQRVADAVKGLQKRVEDIEADLEDKVSSKLRSLFAAPFRIWVTVSHLMLSLPRLSSRMMVHLIIS